MNLGMPEMIFIFLLALIIFGPKKLPEIGRQIGRFMNEFKRASNEFKAQIETEISQLDAADMKRQILPPAEPIHGTVPTGAPALDEAPIPEASPAAELNSVAKAPDV